MLLTLMITIMSVGTAAWFTRKDFYFQDDFVFLHQAGSRALSLNYLRDDLFQHFSPVSRLGDFILANDFAYSYAVAKAVMLVLFGLAVLAFAWTIAAILPSPWRHLLTVLFGESLALIHLVGWWTAALNILPATILGLVTIGAYIRFRQTGNGLFAVLTVVAYLLSLLTHESSWLVFGFLVLFELLVLNSARRLAVGPWRNRQNFWLWAALMVLTLLAIANYMAFYYAPVKPRPSLGEMLRFTGILFGQALSPSLTGYRPLRSGAVPPGPVVLDVAIVIAVMLATSWLFRGGWRPWVVFILGFFADDLMVGLNRVGLYGPGFGKSMLYVQSPAYLFLVCLAFAMQMDRRVLWLRRAGSHYSSRQHYRESLRRPTIGISLLMGAAVVLFEVGFVTSAQAQESQDANDRMAQTARLYFSTLRRTLSNEVTLENGSVPSDIVLPNFAPYNSIAYVGRVAGIHLRTDPPGKATAVVTSTGVVRPLETGS